MTNIRQLLASNIRAHRKTCGLSQAKLADKVDTATNYIAMIELGKKFPSPQMIERIAFALDIDSVQLFSMEPFQIDSIKKLQKDILSDLEKKISNRFKGLNT
jgi:transcriptional regulator with XRE-family HTH domain